MSTWIASACPGSEGITLELSKEYCNLFEAAGVDLIDVRRRYLQTMNTAWEPRRL